MNKLALITGGNAGIGRGIAEAMCAQNIDVVICGRDEDKTLAAAQRISESTGGNCLGVPCDVRDLESVKHMIELATEVGTSQLDYVVNNAGVARFAAIQEMSPETWNEVIDTNLTGSFNVIHASLPHLAEGAMIFNVESIAAVRPFATGAAYNASKAGLHAMSEAIMLDLRQQGQAPGRDRQPGQEPVHRQYEP